MAVVAVLGAGSWGTALAVVLAKNGHQVFLWGRDQEKIAKMREIRQNTIYLPGVSLPEKIKITDDLENAVAKAQYLVLAVPSQSVRELCRTIKKYIQKDVLVINTAKGIEIATLKCLSEVIREELRGKTIYVSVLSGPSHAEEVGQELPTTVVAGSNIVHIAEEVQDLFMSPRFRVYTNPDLVGIELGGALKNVIALATGISDGLGFGDNTKAALITRGITEITRLGTAIGANPLTFSGLTGIGDLIVTCTSMHSRNRRAGIHLGKGIPLKKVLSDMGMVVEGVNATQAAYALREKYDVAMPICEATYQVLFEAKKPKDAVSNLMERQKTHEVEDVALGFPKK